MGVWAWAGLPTHAQEEQDDDQGQGCAEQPQKYQRHCLTPSTGALATGARASWSRRR